MIAIENNISAKIPDGHISGSKLVGCRVVSLRQASDWQVEAIIAERTSRWLEANKAWNRLYESTYHAELRSWYKSRAAHSAKAFERSLFV